MRKKLTQQHTQRQKILSLFAQISEVQEQELNCEQTRKQIMREIMEIRVRQIIIRADKREKTTRYKRR